MCGAAACDAITAALTLTAKASSSASSVSSASAALRKTPTLFTSRSSPPISPAARSTKEPISRGRRRLLRSARARVEREGHVGAALREREHHRPPKARAPAGDDGDLPLEPGLDHAVAGNLPNLSIISASSGLGVDLAQEPRPDPIGGPALDRFQAADHRLDRIGRASAEVTAQGGRNGNPEVDARAHGQAP